MKGIITEKYFGTITGVVNTSNSYIVTAQIPGVMDGQDSITCYPKHHYDEPNIGDKIFIEDIDPKFHSYFTWEKIVEDIDSYNPEKEDTGTFVGFRNRGKSVTFCDSYIKMGVSENGDSVTIKKDPDNKFKATDGGSDSYIPDCYSYISIHNAGGDINIVTKEDTGDLVISVGKNATICIKNNNEIYIDGNSKVNIQGDSEVNIVNNCSITALGNVDFSAKKKMTISALGGLEIASPYTKFTGGMLELDTFDGLPGPFNHVMSCPYAEPCHGYKTVLMKPMNPNDYNK